MSKSMECPVCGKSVALSWPDNKIVSHHRAIAINLAGDIADMTCEGSYRRDFEVTQCAIEWK
jgi:hypothetical protein